MHKKRRICHAQIVVENAYGRLKGRWRRLMKRNDMCIENILQLHVSYIMFVKYMVKHSMSHGCEKLKQVMFIHNQKPALPGTGEVIDQNKSEML